MYEKYALWRYFKLVAPPPGVSAQSTTSPKRRRRRSSASTPGLTAAAADADGDLPARATFSVFTENFTAMDYMSCAMQRYFQLLPDHAAFSSTQQWLPAVYLGITTKAASPDDLAALLAVGACILAVLRLLQQHFQAPSNRQQHRSIGASAVCLL
jgi:hypothetical protein